MKRKLLLSTLIACTLFCIPTQAGTWKHDQNGYWYENDDGTYPTASWFLDTDGKWYFFDENGYMMTNITTQDGYHLGADGVCTNPYNLTATVVPETSYDNVVDGTLPFLYNGELTETPCKIYYNNYRKGTYTTVKYDSMYIQEWNGKNTNLIINYTVEEKGGYNSTYAHWKVSLNGDRLASPKGADGKFTIYFNQNVTSIFIPTETITPGDLVEIFVNS